jgi:hypothetical protein
MVVFIEECVAPWSRMQFQPPSGICSFSRCFAIVSRRGSSYLKWDSMETTIPVMHVSLRPRHPELIPPSRWIPPSRSNAHAFRAWRVESAVGREPAGSPSRSLEIAPSAGRFKVAP